MRFAHRLKTISRIKCKNPVVFAHIVKFSGFPHITKIPVVGRADARLRLTLPSAVKVQAITLTAYCNNEVVCTGTCLKPIPESLYQRIESVVGYALT